MVESVASRAESLINPIHVVILRQRLGKRREDRYMINLAEALRYYDHSVRFLTSYFDPGNCLGEVETGKGNVKVLFSGWWIPDSIFGCFKGTLSVLKTVWMSMRLIIFPPKPRPQIVISDAHPVALQLLATLSNYTTFYVEHFASLKEANYLSSYIRITPSLLTAWWLKCADEIIVQSETMSKIFRRSYPNIKKDLRILCPCVDTGIWQQQHIDINRIIPDLPDDCVLFSVFGRYNTRANFRLAFDAFEQLLLLLEPDQRSRVCIVFAGCTKTVDEVLSYNELIEMAKEKTFANQVTFLRQLPVVHKKTIISKSLAVLHTAKYEVSTDTILAAMCLGAPVIATNMGVAANLLSHRITGLLLDPRPQKFAAAMYKMMTKPTLREFVKDMAMDAFNSNYSFESFSRKLNQLLSKYSRCAVAVAERKE